MAGNGKIRPLETVAAEIAENRGNGKRLVHCHGVFDLLHIGHIRHLERAKAMGDLLVVTVTPDRFVNKGPDRPAFTEQLRLEAVAALSCVDAVALNNWPTAVDTIRLLKPDFFVKGSEFSDPQVDVTGAMALEKQAVESIGGQLALTEEVTFSSSSILNRYLPLLSEDARRFVASFRERHCAEDIFSYLDKARSTKVLVVGEAIIDEYEYCEAFGKSSKAPAIVAKVESSERFAGGILAVANHVSAFCDHVTVVTQLGSGQNHETFIRSRLNRNVAARFLYRRNAPTIVKRRFIESYFLTNLLELYEINDDPLDAVDDRAVCSALHEELAQHDLVIVVDYGHGMLTGSAVTILCEESEFLAMNAQANAGNRGYHRISKYPRADFLCVAKNELFLESSDWRNGLQPVVNEVAKRLSCPQMVVTLGSDGALCYKDGEDIVEVPAMASRVVDRVGAGDTFLSVSALCAAHGAPMDLVGFVGNVAGAQSVATMGHRRYLDRVGLMRHVEALLR